MTDLRIPVTGGMCDLIFGEASSCGTSEGTNPGVAFTLESTSPSHKFGNGLHYSGMGVFSRQDAQKLIDHLTKILKKYPV